MLWDELILFWKKVIEKKKLTAERKDELMSRFTPQIGVEGFCDVDLVIEAIIEDLDVKRDAFVKLDSVCKPETICLQFGGCPGGPKGFC